MQWNCARTVPAATRNAPIPANGTHDEREAWTDVTDSAGVICAENAGGGDRVKATGDGPAKPPSPVQIRAAPPTFAGSIPDTWVTPYSGDMGNSFEPNGLSIGSRRHVSSSKYPK